jgi:tetratricopeptide (TPR) repeat protein
LIDPNNADAHAARAQTFLRLGEHAAAERAARRARLAHPEHVAAHYVLGTSLVRLDRLDEGTAEIATFERLQLAARAARDRAFQIALLREEAMTYANASDYRAAAAALERAIEYAPEDGALLLVVGVLWKQAGHYGPSIERLKQALAHGAPPSVHRHLAEAYAGLGRLDESRLEMTAYEDARRTRTGPSGAAP